MDVHISLWTCMDVFGCVRSLSERTGERENIDRRDYRTFFKSGQSLIFDITFHL